MNIYIDGWCKYCVRFSKLLKSLDFNNSLNIFNFRDTINPKIDIQIAKNRIATIDKKGIVRYGFLSIYEIFKTLPVLWISIPFLFILKYFRIGDYFYDELAIRRKILPIHCDEDNCNI